MNCTEFAEVMVSELCGEIEEEQRLGLQEHVEACRDCKKQQSEFRAIFGLVRQLPQREWDETLHIKDMLRRDQRWRTIVFSKAALWVVALSLALTAASFLPIKWEVSTQAFSIRWGKGATHDEDMAAQLKSLHQELVNLQAQNQKMYQVSEARMRRVLDQNNIAQQKQYWQTLEMFSNYMQLQRKADFQKLQTQIATTYDRTGQEMDRTNQLLDSVLRASATETVGGQ